MGGTIKDRPSGGSKFRLTDSGLKLWSFYGPFVDIIAVQERRKVSVTSNLHLYVMGMFFMNPDSIYKPIGTIFNDV